MSRHPRRKRIMMIWFDSEWYVRLFLTLFWSWRGKTDTPATQGWSGRCQTSNDYKPCLSLQLSFSKYAVSRLQGPGPCDDTWRRSMSSSRRVCRLSAEWWWVSSSAVVLTDGRSDDAQRQVSAHGPHRLLSDRLPEGVSVRPVLYQAGIEEFWLDEEEWTEMLRLVFGRWWY